MALMVCTAAGTVFSDASNPQVMLRVGEAGDVGGKSNQMPIK